MGGRQGSKINKHRDAASRERGPNRSSPTHPSLMEHQGEGIGRVKTHETPRIPGWTAPDFSIKQLRDAVPPHCFERSLVKSFSFLLWDLSWISILSMSATYIDSLQVEFRYVFWPLYWYFQGALMTGVWIIAHECGHRAFSEYAWVDNTVGWVLHSALLVPFYSWKITHAVSPLYAVFLTRLEESSKLASIGVHVGPRRVRPGISPCSLPSISNASDILK